MVKHSEFINNLLNEQEIYMLQESLSKDIFYRLFTQNPIIQQDYYKHLYHLSMILQNVRIKLKYFGLHDILSNDIKKLSLKILDTIEPLLLMSKDQVINTQLSNISLINRPEIESILNKL